MRCTILATALWRSGDCEASAASLCELTTSVSKSRARSSGCFHMLTLDRTASPYLEHASRDETIEGITSKGGTDVFGEPFFLVGNPLGHLVAALGSVVIPCRGNA